MARSNNDLFLWLFATGEETLEEAQIAKIDLAFQKIGLKPGQRLLDIGCGWGYACRRAVEVYGVTAVGLTLSQNQYEDAKGQSQGLTGVEYRLQGWETYRERCDRIVSLGAFEHLTAAKYAAFFARCRELLSPGDLMLLQTITIGKPSESFALLRFA
ncbi:MAG: class I SAM-dependent methyltransferase [Chloroflexi bacterium]|nr:class I SAM-dependent methyltransferase [Chloroflexota bacterium]